MSVTSPNPDSAHNDVLTSLMDEIRGDSEPALGRLMDLCWPELVRYAASQLGDLDLARDMAQEAFIQVWERRRGWRPRGSARVYLYRIVRHLVIDEKRRRAVRRRWQDRQGRDDAMRGGQAATPADGARVVACYASSAAVLARAEATGRAGRNQPDPLPAMLLGRLAVDREHQGRGLAAMLLKHFLLKVLEVAAHTGVRLALVHAANHAAAGFYLHHGFEPSPIDDLTLLLLVKDIAI